MNKKLLYFASLFALMAVGCAKEEDLALSGSNNSGAIDIVVSKSETDSLDTETKTFYQSDANDTLYVAFEPASDNPMVGAYVYDSATSSWSVAKGQQLMWPDGDIDSDVLAYIVPKGAKSTVATAKGFTLSGDQSTPDKLKAEDLFYSFEVDRPHSDASLDINLKRVMAQVELTVVYATEKFGAVTDVVFKSTPSGIEVLDGQFEVESSYASKDIKAYVNNSKWVDTAKVALKDTTIVTAYILPHDWQQRVEFHFGNNPDGPSYFTSSAGSGSFCTLEAGKKYSARLTISGTEVTFDSDIKVSKWEDPVAEQQWFGTSEVWNGEYPTDGYGDYTTWSNYDGDANTLTISNPTELAKFAMYTVAGDNLTVYTSANGKEFCTGLTVKLGANIDLGNHPFFPLGVKFYPKGATGDMNTMTYGAFGGTFDGQGYEIQNLNLVADAHEYSDASSARLAFFSSSEAGGTYKNVTFRGVSCESTVATNVGVLLGYTNSGVSATNIKVYDAVVSASAANSQCGGIVGSCWTYIDLIDCHVGSDVTVTSNKYVGGVIGRAPLQGVFAYCTSAAKVTGANYAGGIIGALGENSVAFNTNLQYFPSNDQMIIGCQSSGVVTATGNAGGIAGYCGTMIAGCYSDAVLVTSSVKKGLIVGELVEVSQTYLDAHVAGGKVSRQPLVYSCYAPAAESTYCIGQIKSIDYNPAVEKYKWTTATYPAPTDEVNNLDRTDVIAAHSIEYSLVGETSSERKSMFVNGSYDSEEVDAMNAAIAVVTTDEGYPAFQSTAKNKDQRATLRNYKLVKNTGYDFALFPYKAVYTEPVVD